MIQVSRREWPKRVVWLQDDTTHERFYWLGVKPEGVIERRKLIAEVEEQTISVTGEDVTGLQFWLSDELLDLEKEVVVKLDRFPKVRSFIAEREFLEGKAREGSWSGPMTAEQRCHREILSGI